MNALPALFALLPAAAAFGQQSAEAVFTADVRLVNLLVTVQDAQGAPLADLTREDFRVTDGGLPREIAVFEKRTNRPLSVALMVDASLSTAIELEFEREAAARFLENLLGEGSHPEDRAAVYKFSDYVEMLSDYTRERKRLTRALNDVRPETGTSVYDGIMLISADLAQRSGRRVIVMVTDGGDTTSRVSFAEGLKAAHDADAAIYPLIVTPIRSDAGRNVGGENALKTFARNTGGQAFVQHGASNLDEAFDEILRSLRTQYLIGYYPPEDAEAPRDGFRRVRVEAAPAGAVVLSRSGYFVPSVPEKKRYRPAAKSSERVRLQTPAEGGPQRRGLAGEAQAEKERRKKPRRGGRRPQIVKPEP